MADNIKYTSPATGTLLATKDIGGVHFGKQIICDGDGNILAPLTDAQLRAADVKITLDGEAVAVTGTFWQATQPVSLAAAVALAAGTNNIGDVDVLTLPALPAGANAIGAVDVKPTGTWTIVSAANAAPAASAVQADTGALAAGSYEMYVSLAAMDTLAVGKGMTVEHRNAANGATTASLGGCVAGNNNEIYIPRITLAASERVRVIAGSAAGAASSRYVSSIKYRLLA